MREGAPAERPDLLRVVRRDAPGGEEIIDALESERLRREVLRRRRELRDEERRRSALAAGDEAQRRPLLERLARGLAASVSRRRVEDRRRRERDRTAMLWRSLGLTSDARRRWSDHGVSSPRQVITARDACLNIASQVRSASLRKALRRAALVGPGPGSLTLAWRACIRLPPAACPPAVIDLEAAGFVGLQEEMLDRLLWLALGSHAVSEASAPPVQASSSHWTSWALAVRLASDAPPRLTAELLAEIDPGVLDELIDREPTAVERCAAQLPPARRVHVLARVAPDRLSDRDVEFLEWRTEAARRRLSRGQLPATLNGLDVRMSALVSLARGDHDELALSSLQECGTPDEREKARLLLAMSESEMVPSLLADDTSAWPVVLRLLGPATPAIVGSQPTSRLGQWLALHEVRRAVYTSDLDRAMTVVEPLLAIEHSVSNGVMCELLTGRAYLFALRGERKSALRDARAAHKRIANANTERNVTLVRDRPALQRLSPYLTLGLPDGAQGWRSVWAQRWREDWLNPAAAEQLTWAKATLEGKDGNGRWLGYPLRPGRYEPAPTKQGLLHPAPEGRARQTPPLDGDYLATLHRRATRHILNSLCLTEQDRNLQEGKSI